VKLGVRRDVALLGVGAAGLVAVLSASTVAAAPPADAAPAPRVHAVKAGDTLRALARRYGVTIGAIVAANRLPGAGVVLQLGQRLVIPTAPSVSAPRVATPEEGVRGSAPSQPASRPPGVRPPTYIALAVPDVDELGVVFAWPVDGFVTSSFGRRRSGWHRGIDIKAESGTPVRAAAAGVVVMSGVGPRYGRVIKVEHDEGFVTVYAHNAQNLVEAGDHVAAGETIATVGRTGRATTPHLHFEIRHQGRNYNPLYLLPLPPRIAGVEQTDDTPPDE
jgi:murein DD-endopeptidase MepM/ murein hydrolase activator NlpD